MIYLTLPYSAKIRAYKKAKFLAERHHFVRPFLYQAAIIHAGFCQCHHFASVNFVKARLWTADFAQLTLTKGADLC